MVIDKQFERTALIIGEDGVRRLQRSRVLLFGVGGVGSYTAEALVRAGVGHLTIVDFDEVDTTNLNRQLIALQSTIGKDKVTVAAERYHDIARDCEITPVKAQVTPENITDFAVGDYDFVIDAIDMVSAKIAIIEAGRDAGIPVITCMGTGNKTDPTALKVTTVEKTAGCPLAKVMRRELKRRGITGVKCVYSEEQPISHNRPVGSMACVPGVAGLIIAGEVIRELVEIC